MCVCVSVCVALLLLIPRFMCTSRVGRTLNTGKESSDLHLEKGYALWGVTLPDNSNFDR